MGQDGDGEEDEGHVQFPAFLDSVQEGPTREGDGVVGRVLEVDLVDVGDVPVPVCLVVCRPPNSLD